MSKSTFFHIEFDYFLIKATTKKYNKIIFLSHLIDFKNKMLISFMTTVGWTKKVLKDKKQNKNTPKL